MANSPPLSNGRGTAKEAFDAACGVTGWTLHDLRRTYATKLAALKVPPHIVERLLNRKLGSIQNRTDGTVGAVAEVYNRHLYIGEMREAVKAWEAYLAGLLNPTSLQGDPTSSKGRITDKSFLHLYRFRVFLQNSCEALRQQCVDISK